MLIHIAASRICLIFLSAWIFLCLSDIPLQVPQKLFELRPMCFYIALAPTVMMGGFEFPSSYSGVRIVYSLLKHLISSSLDGNILSTLDMVFRTPRQVRNPLGPMLQKKSISSF